MTLLSEKKFVPHTLEHLTQVRAFPSPFPEVAYNKLLAAYAELDGVSISDITYESDGLTISGIMALPSKKNSKCPIVIYNRGGSREYGKLTIYTIMRVFVPLVRAGHMVFASNYRGNSEGDGKEEFGGADVNDVLNLLNIARYNENFDVRNVFMMGHSRGGMMTELALKRGAKANAAIAIAGIADAHKLTAYPNLLEHVLKPLVPGFMEHPNEVLDERSALCWPERISAPLLLLHGDADKDVDVSDSIRLHEAIQKAGGVSELVIYPTGSHALVRSWDDVMARSMAWMEKYRL